MLSERIKNIRESKGITLKELGKKIGKTEATVQRYESGAIKNVNNEIVEDIAEALKVSPAYLMGWTEIASTQMIKIPILGSIACGDPITAEENIDSFKERTTEDLPSGNLFYLKTKGDSMEPLIQEGALVLIREQADVENGEIAAVLVNGDEEATLKRVRKLGDAILLEAINDQYEPYIINSNNPARILGKAIEATFEF